MTARMQKLAIFIFAGVLYLTGQYFLGDWLKQFPSLCLYKESATGAYCNYPYFNTGFALIAAGEIFAIIAVILLFANGEGLRKWFRLSRWYVPITAIAAFSIGSLSPIGILHPSNEGDPELWVWLFGIIYALITLKIVIWSWWRGRKVS